jgi:uncharacterized damage-inducible protein DinB
MIAYSSQDLARSFRTVRKNTIQIAHDIPAEQWTFRPAPDTRSVHELLAHIAAITYSRQRLHIRDRKTFISFEEFRAYDAEGTAYEKSLTTREAVLSALQANGEEFAALLESLSDADLAERVNFPPPLDPPSKSRFELLLAVKEHEMHHRAQLMLIQRMLGMIPHLTAAYRARTQPAPAVH